MANGFGGIGALNPQVIQQLLSQLVPGAGGVPTPLGAGGMPGLSAAPVAPTVPSIPPVPAIPPIARPEAMGVAGATGKPAGSGTAGNILYAPPTPTPQTKSQSGKIPQVSGAKDDTWNNDFIHVVGQQTGQYVNPATLGINSREDANLWLTQWGFSPMPSQGTEGLY